MKKPAPRRPAPDAFSLVVGLLFLGVAVGVLYWTNTNDSESLLRAVPAYLVFLGVTGLFISRKA